MNSQGELITRFIKRQSRFFEYAVRRETESDATTGKEDRRRAREIVLDLLVSWNEGIFVSDTILSKRSRRICKDIITNVTWHGYKTLIRNGVKHTILH